MFCFFKHTSHNVPTFRLGAIPLALAVLSLPRERLDPSSKGWNLRGQNGEPTLWSKIGFCPGRWPSWLECHPGHRRGVGLIPGRGSCRGFRFHPAVALTGGSRRASIVGPSAWERAKLCQAGRGGPSLGLGPSSHRRKPGQHEPRLSQLPSFCVPLASSQRRPKAAVSWKRSWPSPAPRSEWLLVVIFRMSWTVGGRGSLSPALAERIMGALEYNASSSSWPRSQPVPRCGLWVAGVTVEAVGLET